MGRSRAKEIEREKLGVMYVSAKMDGGLFACRSLLLANRFISHYYLSSTNKPPYHALSATSNELGTNPGRCSPTAAHAVECALLLEVDSGLPLALEPEPRAGDLVVGNMYQVLIIEKSTSIIIMFLLYRFYCLMLCFLSRTVYKRDDGK